MRHKMRGRHLSRTAAHRKALRQNITNSLFTYGRIITTLEKAKETKSFAEKIITLVKKGLIKKDSDRAGYVHCYRLVLSKLRNAEVVKKLFGEGPWREIGGIAQRYISRPGGYTRILKLSGSRLGVLSGSNVGKIPVLEYRMEGMERKLRMIGRRLNDNASRVIFELVECSEDAKSIEEVKPEIAVT
jgi:large subunit ribosomal protein L17